jgi:hypothetical protein
MVNQETTPSFVNPFVLGPLKTTYPFSFFGRHVETITPFNGEVYHFYKYETHNTSVGKELWDYGDLPPDVQSFDSHDFGQPIGKQKQLLLGSVDKMRKECIMHTSM